MDPENYFKDLFESKNDYRKLVFFLFLIKKDIVLIKECGVLKNDINRLCLEFKNMLMKQNEEYLNYIQNEEESFIEKISNN